jgi:protein XRP2
MMNKLEDKFEYRDAGCGFEKNHNFDIRYCKNSKIFIHERTAEIKVDQCEGSDIVLGPTVSSTFIRDCKDCSFVVICKQLRMRDCHNVRIQLYS